jgi:hypothetical protein
VQTQVVGSIIPGERENRAWEVTMRGLWTEPVVVADEDEVPQGATERRVSE